MFRAARPKFVFAPHRRFASLGSPYFQNLLPSPLYIRSTYAIQASVQGFLQPLATPRLRFFSTAEEGPEGFMTPNHQQLIPTRKIFPENPGPWRW